MKPHTERIWVCLDGPENPCQPSGRCSDGCSWRPKPDPTTENR